MSTNNKPDAQAPGSPRAEDAADRPRRDALLAIGKYGAYTAPAMVGMLTGQAYAQGSNNGR